MSRFNCFAYEHCINSSLYGQLCIGSERLIRFIRVNEKWKNKAILGHVADNNN